jgi:hypothetical protein
MFGLRSIAERYHLSIGTLKVWAPYWINSSEPPFWLGAPYRGKATAGQLERTARQHLGTEGRIVSDVDEARTFMTQHGLGVDCSGFTYHVLDQWLQQRRMRLAQFLLIDEREIKSRNERRPQLGAKWEQRPIPQSMPLIAACKVWQGDPAQLVNVRRLLDPSVVMAVVAAGDIKPGDMIGMSNNRSEDHIGLVLEVGDESITYADSAYESGPGVQVREIMIYEWDQDLSQQEWSQHNLFHPGRQGRVDGAWRLRALS